MNNRECSTEKKIARVLGVPFTQSSFEDILATMARNIVIPRQTCHISITNTESTFYATRIQSHLDYINGAEYSCCDGVGVVVAARALGHKIPRLHGPDLLLKCCEYGIDRGWRHFFYGGKEGVPDLLARNLGERCPGLLVAGTHSPPFRPLTPGEDEEVVRMINQSEPDILWVGLGLLKQERWIDNHKPRLNVPWVIGVGAAFDFYAGTIKRAPKAFRSMGLEWLYRLAFEPRMFIRNMRSFSLLFEAGRRAIIMRVTETKREG